MKKTWLRILWVLAGTVVVLIVAAIVIPNLLRVHITDGQPPGPSQTRTLMTAEIQYQTLYGHYASDIRVLGGVGWDCRTSTSDHACLIDEPIVNSSPTQPAYGYYGAKLGPNPLTFVVWGVPVALHQKSYCGVDDGVVRVDETGSFASASTYTRCKALPPLTY